MTQGYSNSPAPQIMGQVAGTLGRSMNPQIQSPLEQLDRQIQNPFTPGGVGTSPEGRPGVMPPDTDPGYGIPGSRNTGGGMPSGGAVVEMSVRENLVVVRLVGAGGVTASDLRRRKALSESRWANAAAATAA